MGQDTVRGYKLDLVSEPSHSSHNESRSAPVHPTGSNRFDKHGGELGGIRPPDRFLFNPVFGSQERWGSETSNKFESTKRICSNATFQDGRNPYLEGRPVDWLTKLDTKDTYVLYNSYPPRSQEVSQVSPAGETLQVQLSPLWPLISPLGLYQDPKASIFSSTRIRSAHGGLHRRYTGISGVQANVGRSGLRAGLRTS